jgi:uncharacterized membrane protein YjfL (UPF0719 family)
MDILASQGAFLAALVSGVAYLSVAAMLFMANLWLFERWTPFNVKEAIFDTQNRAIGQIVRGQLIAQGIMIGSLIYFTGSTPEHIFQMNVFAASLRSTVLFGIFGMASFQFLLWGLTKAIPLEKEIILEQNESLALIIEGFLIALAILVSVAFYSY